MLAYNYSLRYILIRLAAETQEPPLTLTLHLQSPEEDAGATASTCSTRSTAREARELFANVLRQLAAYAQTPGPNGRTTRKVRGHELIPRAMPVLPAQDARRAPTRRQLGRVGGRTVSWCLQCGVQRTAAVRGWRNPGVSGRMLVGAGARRAGVMRERNVGGAD